MEKNRKFFDIEEIRSNIFDGKISKAYLYVLVKEGKIRTIKIGKKILIPAAEANRLLNEGVQ